MQPIKTLNDMIVFLQQRGDKKRVAVICANDASTRYAVEKGQEMGFIEPIYVDGDDKDECARRAVSMVRNGEGILVRGNTKIEAGDHVMVFCLKQTIQKIEKYFN